MKLHCLWNFFVLSLQFFSINSSWEDLFNRKNILYYTKVHITYQTVVLSYICPDVVYISGKVSKKTAAVSSRFFCRMKMIKTYPIKKYSICKMHFLIYSIQPSVIQIYEFTQKMNILYNVYAIHPCTYLVYKMSFHSLFCL